MQTTVTAEKAQITGIGSLPHHNVDSALAYSFLHDIPFLPQLPIRHPNEFMIQQAVEHLPGLLPLQGGTESRVDLKEWLAHKEEYQARIDRALKQKSYDDFLPTPEMVSAWQGFLFEIEERSTKRVKVQIAGPLTTELVMKLSDGEALWRYPELLSHVYSTITLEALAMVKAIQEKGAQVLIFLDEPGLYAYNPKDPNIMTSFQELKLLLLTLKKEGAQVGMHCCCNTDWEQVLSLPLDYLSFDTDLSLPSLLNCQEALLAYLERGGKLSLGIIPTNNNSQIEMRPMIEVTLALLDRFFQGKETLYRKVLNEMLLTTACGLAYKGPSMAEDSLTELRRFQEKFLQKES